MAKEIQVKKWLRRMLARWRSRGWKAEDHDDCMAFMGPCNFCREYIIARGYPDPWRPRSLPEARVITAGDLVTLVRKQRRED